MLSRLCRLQRALSPLMTKQRWCSQALQVPLAEAEEDTFGFGKTRLLSHENILPFMQKYDTLLLDCDGVVWSNDHFTPIPGIAETVDKLRRYGKKLLFVTNNAIHDRKDYIQTFKDLAGIRLSPDEIFPVTYCSALYVSNIIRSDQKVYVLGSEGLQRELDELGVKSIGYGPDEDLLSDHPEDLTSQKLDPKVQVVLISYDIHFNFNKLVKAASYLRKPYCMYIATNDHHEAGVPLGDKHIQPITGSFVSAVSAACRRKPTVVGKPYLHLFRCLQGVHNIDPRRTIMIGDSLNTDVPFAVNAGIDSLLVLSGVSKLEDLENPRVQDFPTYLLPSLSDINRLIP